jgi:hypothetical protein
VDAIKNAEIVGQAFSTLPTPFNNSDYNRNAF